MGPWGAEVGPWGAKGPDFSNVPRDEAYLILAVSRVPSNEAYLILAMSRGMKHT